MIYLRPVLIVICLDSSPLPLSCLVVAWSNTATASTCCYMWGNTGNNAHQEHAGTLECRAHNLLHNTQHRIQKMKTHLYEGIELL